MPNCSMRLHVVVNLTRISDVSEIILVIEVCPKILQKAKRKLTSLQRDWNPHPLSFQTNTKTFNQTGALARLTKWMNVGLRTKRLLVWFSLHYLKLQISRLFQASSSWGSGNFKGKIHSIHVCNLTKTHS